MTATRTVLFAGLAAGLLSGTSMAQDSRNQGYLVDTFGNNIVTSSNTGLCWRTSDWTPGRSVEPCDPVAKRADAAAPGVVAAAPAPTKPAAPEKAATRSITLSADVLFAFDRAEIKPEGKTVLDEFVRQLGATDYEVIVVTGHADRFGSNDYNQKLSERRASAVKDYLAGRNVPASRMTASGRGETEPVTRGTDCPGAKSGRVVTCLQPDRRVHVEVRGTEAPATGAR